MTTLAPLIDQARAGDPAAVERLLRHAQPDLRRYARHHCPAEHVDDAVQDALWIVARRVGTLRAAAAFSGWLWQVVRRLCIRLGMLQPRTVSLDDESAAPLAEAALAISPHEADQLRLDLARSLAALPAHEREVLVLVDVLGHTAEETAGRLAITVEAVKSRLHRGRTRVRRALAG